MLRSFFQPSWKKTSALMAASAVLAATITVSATSTSTSAPKTFYACLLGGQLGHVALSPQSCAKGKLVSWNQSGPAGAAGIKGSAGVRGASGLTGPTGPRGTDGSMGPMGPQGIAGLRGIPGEQGAQGAQGVQGPAGGNGICILMTLCSWGLNGGSYTRPTGVATDGANVWVADSGDNSLTKVAQDGSTKVFDNGLDYGFSYPNQIAFDGRHLWVTNTGVINGNTITELNAIDGSLVQRLTTKEYGLKNPTGIAFDGVNIWVANKDANSLTEINAADGKLIRVLKDDAYQFNSPTRIAFDGHHLWVTNAGGNSLTEIDPANGDLLNVISGPDYSFNKPWGITFDGHNLWIANFGTENSALGSSEAGSDSLTEISTSGDFIRLVESLPDSTSGIPAPFFGPRDMAFDGRHLWVTNFGQKFCTDVDGKKVPQTNSQTIVEVDVDSGAVVAILSGPTFGFGSPAGIAFDGQHLWVANQTGNSFTGNPFSSLTEVFTH